MKVCVPVVDQKRRESVVFLVWSCGYRRTTIVSYKNKYTTKSRHNFADAVSYGTVLQLVLKADHHVDPD